jgi:hypothetical protein
MFPLHRYLRLLGVVVLLLLAVPMSAPTQAQEEGFPLSATAAYCEPGYEWPFSGCTPWEGVTVSFASTDGTFSTSCVTSGTEQNAYCTVFVPFGSTIVTSIDPSIIPDGYVLEGNVAQEFQIPDGPPDGVFGFASYVLLPAAQEAPPQDDGFLLGASTTYCEPGFMGPFVGCTPWEGVTVSFASTDGTFSTSCVTAGTYRAAFCTVYVPFGSTILASIDSAVVPDGHVLQNTVTQEIQIPDGPPDGEFGGAVYVLFPAAQQAPVATEAPSVPTAEPAAPAPTVAPAPAVEEGGMEAAFFSASCDAVDPGQPVATLTASRVPEGTPVGLEGAVPVATGFTVVPLSLDDIIAGDHVLAVFDEDDPGLMVACGPVGGVLDSNGALTIGLLPVDDSGVTGVAYLAEQDAAVTGISLFILEQELVAD